MHVQSNSQIFSLNKSVKKPGMSIVFHCIFVTIPNTVNMLSCDLLNLNREVLFDFTKD